MESSNLIKLLTCFTAFVHNALFQVHFSKLSLYNYGDIIGGCDVKVCTDSPGTPRGAAYGEQYDKPSVSGATGLFG
jgi:hypothetical protein